MKVNLMSTKSRNYFLDNYKALLIVLVVIGHFIEPCYENNDFLTILKWVIFSFHMPAFIFISGFFSKKDITLGKLIQKLVIPYFVFELLCYLLYVFVIHKETGLYFNRPKFSLWYLMSLFFWRIITPYIRKIPGNLFIAITGGLLIGLTQLGNFFSIPRTLFFYPFFLAGYYFREEWFQALRKRRKLLGAALFGVTGFVLFAVKTAGLNLSPYIFYGRYSYADMGTSDTIGILIRLGCYGISFLALFTVCGVIPQKQHFFSILGVRTMSIYLFHGLVYSLLKATPVLKAVTSLPETALLLGFCVLLTFLLAANGPFKFVTYISAFPIKRPPAPPALPSVRHRNRLPHS